MNIYCISIPIAFRLALLLAQQREFFSSLDKNQKRTNERTKKKQNENKEEKITGDIVYVNERKKTRCSDGVVILRSGPQRKQHRRPAFSAQNCELNAAAQRQIEKLLHTLSWDTFKHYLIKRILQRHQRNRAKEENNVH